jgi:hypothetical protein
MMDVIHCVAADWNVPFSVKDSWSFSRNRQCEEAAVMAHFSKFLWIIALAGVAVAINMFRYPAISEALVDGLDKAEDPSVDETDVAFQMEQDLDSPEADQVPVRRGSMDVYATNTAEFESLPPQTFSTDELNLADGGLRPMPDSRKWVRPIPAPPSLRGELAAYNVDEEEETPERDPYSTSYPFSTSEHESDENASTPSSLWSEEEEEVAAIPRPFTPSRDSSVAESPWNAPSNAVEPPDFHEEPSVIREAPPSSFAFGDDTQFTPHRMTTIPENIDEDPQLDDSEPFSFEDEQDRFAGDDFSSEAGDDELRSGTTDERNSLASEENAVDSELNSDSWEDENDAEVTRTEIASEPTPSGSPWGWGSPTGRTPGVDRTGSERSSTGRRSYPDPAVAALEASREPTPSGPPLSHYDRQTSTIPASTPSNSMEPIRTQTPTEDEMGTRSTEREASGWQSRRPSPIEGVSVPLSSSQPTPTIRPLPPITDG